MGWLIGIGIAGVVLGFITPMMFFVITAWVAFMTWAMDR